MLNPTVPGVYIDEVTGPGVIAGVGTSVAAFIGPALNGDYLQPTLVTSWEDFVRGFGRSDGNVYIEPPISTRRYLAHAVRGFFENGGSVAYVVRVRVGAGASRASHDFLYGDGSTVAFTLTALDEGTAGRQIAVDVRPSGDFFDLVVSNGSVTQTSAGLSPDPANPRFFGRAFFSTLVSLTQGASRPGTAGLAAAGGVHLDGGADENLSTLSPSDFDAGLAALDAIRDVNLIAVPDCQDAVFQRSIVDHCENLGDRFALLDAQLNRTTSQVQGDREALSSPRGFGALYYPWITVRRVLNGTDQTIAIPPSGHLAGIYSRVDQQRGVHKAPANEVIQGVVDLERRVTDAEQGVLNPLGINVLRILPGEGRPIVWGARTVVRHDVTDWWYVSVRRLAIYLEQSIEAGTRWAVFEPNNLQLWQKVKRTITEFLTRVWQSGALFGATAKEAFYVRVDEAINPESERVLGRLHVEVGFRPSYPAEFIVVKIGIWDGGSSRIES